MKELTDAEKFEAAVLGKHVLYTSTEYKKQITHISASLLEAARTILKVEIESTEIKSLSLDDLWGKEIKFLQAFRSNSVSTEREKGMLKEIVFEFADSEKQITFMKVFSYSILSAGIDGWKYCTEEIGEHVKRVKIRR